MLTKLIKAILRHRKQPKWVPIPVEFHSTRGADETLSDFLDRSSREADAYFNQLD